MLLLHLSPVHHTLNSLLLRHRSVHFKEYARTYPHSLHPYHSPPITPALTCILSTLLLCALSLFSPILLHTHCSFILSPPLSCSCCSSSSSSICSDGLKALIAAGVDFTVEPHYRRCLLLMYEQSVRRLRTKTHIPVQKGALLMGTYAVSYSLISNFTL
jgi:hypothetical protein